MKTTTAQSEYAARQARVKALLATLSDRLDAHAKKAAGQPGNWGFAGDLGRLEAGLEELRECLGK